ncbi:MAG TPA: DUF4390 domain-containing protein [Gemmatimonadales bacterium]|nr:DUF4390 domain-containing protein [Gemmatimonadales bacterium]
MAPAARRLLLVLALLPAVAGQARAQDTTKVRLDVTLASDTTAEGFRLPLVRTRNLAHDDRWLTMLSSGFPVRLHYQIELWRAREGWFDALERAVEWDVVVRHEPLLDQYTVTRLIARQRREARYATTDALAAALGQAYRVAVANGISGKLYYVATLEITTLSDSDLDELERFLKGDLTPAAEGQGDVGSAVGRGAKRLVLKLAGLPSLSLSSQSERFESR